MVIVKYLLSNHIQVEVICTVKSLELVGFVVSALERATM